MAKKFLSDIELDAGLVDVNGNTGTSGQILSSTGTSVDWINQGDIVAGETDKALSLTLRVKNTESAALTKGQVVCAAPSATPPSGNLIEVKLADNNGTDSMPAIGVLNEGLDAAGGANDEGEAIMFGRISGIDTSAFSVGDEVFVSDTPGALTTTKPTGVKYIQKIGVVIRDHASNGTIEVFGAGRTNDVPTPLYIDHANQRVGIGKETPSVDLHINNDSTFPELRLSYETPSGYGGGGNIRIQGGSSDYVSGSIQWYNAQNRDAQLSYYGASRSMNFHVNERSISGNGYFRFYNGSTEIAEINPAGVYGNVFYDQGNTAYYLNPASTTTALNTPLGSARVKDVFIGNSTGQISNRVWFDNGSSNQPGLYFEGGQPKFIIYSAVSNIFHDTYHPNADTWTTGRTITIGNTGKSVNGSADVSWTLSEIGAAAASHNHDDRYYTESEMQTFFNRGYISAHSSDNVPIGWYTIATNTGNRALGEFQIWDVASSRHQSVLFNASHHYGTDSSNDITVLANSRFSTDVFRYIRIKEYGTYDGAALQVYIDNSTNAVHAAITGANAQESGWVLKDWIADATDPGDLDNYSSFTEKCKVDLDNTRDGGIITTGEVYAGGATTQYRAFHDAYHPNADTWTAARTINLGGDLSGSVSIDGSGDVTLSAQVTNNSHQHNALYENSTITYGASQLQWMDINGTGGTGLNGSSPQNPTNDWHYHMLMNHANSNGYYVDLAFDFHDDNVWFQRNEAGTLQGWRQMFHDGYHPNADTWTTGRTITIGNTGKSVNGSANVSWSLSEIGAASSSHNHDSDYVELTGDTMSGPLVIDEADTTDKWLFRVDNNGSNYSGFWSASQDIQLYLRNQAGNVQVHLKPDARSLFAEGLEASSLYDINDTAYYLNPASSSVVNDLKGTRIWAGYDANVDSSISCSNWFRSSGSTGWYNASYGGGIYMVDSTWVRVYNNKKFYNENTIESNSGMYAPIFYDRDNTDYRFNGSASKDEVDLTSSGNYAVHVLGTISGGHRKHNNLETPEMEWSVGGSTDLNWKKLCDVVISDANYAGWGAEIEITNFSGNYGNTTYSGGELFKGALSIYHWGGTGTTPEIAYSNIPYEMRSHVRWYKINETGQNRYQLQVKSPANYQQLYVKVKPGIANQLADIITYANDTNGNTSGGTAYTSIQSSNFNHEFSGGIWTNDSRSIGWKNAYGSPYLSTYYGAITTSTSLYVGGPFSTTTNLYAGPIRGTIFYERSNTAYYMDGGSTGDSIRVAGDVVAYYSSDKRYKENIKPIENALDKVKAINGVTFNWNEKSHKETGKKDVGVIAQEVEEVFPEIVETRRNGYKAVDYQKLTAVLIESVKELTAKVEALEAKQCNCK